MKLFWSVALINVKMKGVNDLLKKVQQLKSVSDKVVVAGLAQVGVDIANDARANHTFINRTNNLEGSIHPLPVEMRGRRFIQKVVAAMEYAEYVEFGTEKTNAYPFMHPALNRNKDNLKTTMSAVIEAGMKEVCK